MHVWLLVCALSVIAFGAPADERKAAPEPRISSIHPFSTQIGNAHRAVIRGLNLKDAQRVEFAVDGVKGRVLGVKEEAPSESDTKNAKATDLVEIEITSDATIAPGKKGLRLLTSNGISNEIPIMFATEPVIDEGAAPVPARSFPLILSGRISQRGETDVFWFEATAGQTLTFQTASGHNSLDLALGLYRPSPSWFDPNHMEQIAYNDEPLFFPGLSTDAQITHTFQKSGRYCLKVLSSSGQGSADAVYELRILGGAVPPPSLHPLSKTQRDVWEERQFTRALALDRNELLARRGGMKIDTQSVEAYRAVRVGSGEPVPLMRLPGVVEGRIPDVAEAHRIKFRIEKAEDIAIEIETPEATMPRFNPVVLLYEPGGTEVATNVYTKRNNNGLYMMKMIQPKVALPLQAPGDYEIEIRDITTDRSGGDFRYRVLVRRQIPHVGKVQIAEDRINLRKGASREIGIEVEREEGFSGVVVLTVEGLPQGVTCLPAIPKPIDRPPLPNGGKLERYAPIVQNSALVFVTAGDAPSMEVPAIVRIVARPMVNGKMGEAIPVKELPLMILPENAT